MRAAFALSAALFAAAAPQALAAPPGPLARAADTCSLYAPPKEAVEKVFGKGEAQQAPIAEKEFCYVEGVTGSVKIYPYRAKQAKAKQALWLGGFTSSYGHVKKSHPAHLGRGATLLSTGHNAELVIWFTRGGHFVVIESLLTPKPAQMLAFAKLVYAKL